jgi:hypothetical protein
MQTTGQPAFTDSELREIESFLRESYARLAESAAAARQRNPDRSASRELNRLRQARLRASTKRLTQADLEELDLTAESDFASEFGAARERALKRLEREVGLTVGLRPNPSFGVLLLKHAALRLCTQQKSLGPTSWLISAGGLGWLMQHLGWDPVLAPAVVWFGAMARDQGLGSLCAAIDEYVGGIGIVTTPASSRTARTSAGAEPQQIADQPADDTSDADQAE